MFLIINDRNPRKFVETPYVTWAIIGVCILIFIWQSGLSTVEENNLIKTYGLVPRDLQVFEASAIVGLFSSLFLHAGFWHLAGNMWFLNTFGDNVEDAMGHAKFLAFYLIGGIAAGVAHYFSASDSYIPLVGASGAISAVVGAYFLLHPRARVRVLILIFPIYLSARILIGLWFAFQVLSAFGDSSSSGGVAFWAHVGGFVAGMALVKFFIRPEAKLWPSKDEDEDLQSWLEYKGLKKKKPEVIRAQGPWRKEPDAVIVEEGQDPWIIPKPDPRERRRPRSRLPENPRK
ncbi:rhomboid family intramembrane serine protease [Alphaproteobacteria bacterium]|nr:rhomboid family intramembrane serine protease [Alphaproteobacteria bacterium]